MGVCKANPRIKETNPNETAAVYHFANTKLTTIKAAAKTLSSRISRIILYCCFFVGERLVTIDSIPLVTIKTRKTTKPARDNR